MIKIIRNILFGKPIKGVSSQPKGISHVIVPQQFLRDFPHNSLNSNDKTILI